MKNISKFVFVLYFLFLTWLILFKLSPNLPAFMASAAGRSLNLIPFAKSGGFMEIALNVVAFVPYGGLLIAASHKRKFSKHFLIVMLTSVGYETFQYVFAVGATDITDVITNLAGGLLGFGIFLAAERLLGGKFARALLIFGGLLIVVVGILVSQTGLLGLRMRF